MANEKILSKVLEILKLGKPDMKVFDDRLRLQKIIYLLQSSGMSLGYGYSWYVKGPYSSPLAHDLFKIESSFEIYENNAEIKFKNEEVIRNKLDSFRIYLGDDITNASYLEVLASIHYINEATFSGRGTLDQLKSKLLEAKPSLLNVENIEEIINKAYQNLQKFEGIYGS
ncbi:hypothetical protein HNV12_06250 [Methanococcoides sp. SA1]|nr:hypothetical protein [Methanococcoides sp. SA1]